MIKILIKNAKAVLTENKDKDKVNGYSLRINDHDKDFVSKIKSIAGKLKTKVKELEPEIRNLRKRKMDIETLSILLYKEGFSLVIFVKLFSRLVDDKLQIQTLFSKNMMVLMLSR